MASPFVRIAPTAHSRATSLLRAVQAVPSCPCHSNPYPHSHHALPRRRSLATPLDPSRQSDYAFEMAASAIRFGPGCTSEVGMDLANLKAKNVCVVTDATVGKLPVMDTVREALEKEGVKYSVFDGVRVEPKDTSIKEAITYSRSRHPDAFLAVGGGSVIDTAKLMNLYAAHHTASFLDFVNAPVGAGLPVTNTLQPLIAIPTTAGTGSETTGTAIFDLSSATSAHTSKTGIASRALKPTLGICDPHNTATMPLAVAASSGLDVLCHALESYTAIPFHRRTPRPTNPILRPAYQGANPISDVFSLTALRSVIRHLPLALSADDSPARDQARDAMLLASTLAGVGFGNAGVHLCHGMSYPISSQNPQGYRHEGYAVDHAIIPHGVSVAVTAPAVFRFTAASDPDRHLEVARLFGVDTARVRREDAGNVLADAIEAFLQTLPGGQPRGLKALGFSSEHVEGLVEGVLPQRRVLNLAPGLSDDSAREREELAGLFEGAM